LKQAAQPEPMRLLPALLALPLAVALLSGCLDGKESSSPGSTTSDDSSVYTGIRPATVWPPIQDIMAGVPCEVPVGGDTSSNLVQLSNVSYGDSDGGHAEIDIRGTLALHARYFTGGFEMIDITDPLAPKHIGNFTLGENEGALDVKFSPDNATALYGADGGIVMADIRDPYHPQYAGRWNFTDAGVTTDPLPRVSQNAHMLYTKRIADQDWVFLAPNSNTGVWVLKLEGTPEARKLTYVTQTLPVEGGPLGPHDLFVGQDEVDGNWYLYSADGFHGWTAFNVNDPSHPELVGGIANPVEGAYTHTIQAAWVNGRRLVATIGEVGANALKVYDATNLRAPLLLAVYQAEPGAGSTAPEHNFNMAGGKLYLSYYTLGMYVFDLTQLSGLPVAGTAELSPVAHYGDNGETPPTALSFSEIWDTVLQDGLIYLSNIDGGLFVVGFGCNAVPDPALTSTG
jgi:hypothetical protein